MRFSPVPVCVGFLFAMLVVVAPVVAAPPGEAVPGEGVWIDPAIAEKGEGGEVRVTVWFDRQFLGDGEAYTRRAEEFSGTGRSELRERTIAALREISRASHEAAAAALEELEGKDVVRGLERHWIVNGFSCSISTEEIGELAAVPGVKKIFAARQAPPRGEAGGIASAPPAEAPEKASMENLPWFISALHADVTWEETGIAGQGTLNVIHDSNFIITPSLARTIYRRPGEIPENGKDDDGNGLIDDAHGYNFDLDVASLTTSDRIDRRTLHGTSCATIVCGAEAENGAPQYGIAPLGRWAGVISRGRIEAAVEWAIEQGADTYSMSFSIPHLGEYRSHWRKLMEHGSFCGVLFVSGAGNFAKTEKQPVQMRTPEDIPLAVFAAAGVTRKLGRQPFSSKGPVEWNTEHYKDGRVQKPAVCAFNTALPYLLPDGTLAKDTISGNSFAGPMFCGAIALMLSADPELLPWELREIITSTATDVGPEGVDDETGHGLIDIRKAVGEVLRRKALKGGGSR